MRSFITQRWILFPVLIIFIACKVPHLHYAFYWDEAWPYAPALRAMYDHGASLLPTAIDADLSRGHPLLFHALAALWMQVSGTSHVAMHAFALFLAVVTLITVHEVALQLFSPKAAVIALLLAPTQVAFFVQSSMVLPEISLVLFALLSLYLYTKGRYLLAGLVITALFFTKESGLMMAPVLGADALIGLFDKRQEWKLRTHRVLAVAIPSVLIATFFVVQRYTLGWWFFPMHIGFIDYSWNAFWYKLRMGCIHAALYDGLKYYYLILVLALAVIAAVKNKKAAYLSIFLPGTCIYYFVDDMRAGRLLPSVPFFIVFVASVVFFLYRYTKRFYYRPAQKKFLVLCCMFVLLFLCFSAINFFTYRYALLATIPMLLVIAALMDMLIARSYRWLYIPSLLVVLLIGHYSFKLNDSYGDCDLGAFDAIEVQQQVVDHLEQNGYRDRPVGTRSGLLTLYLQKPATGYLHGGRGFSKVSGGIGNDAGVVVVENMDGGISAKGVLVSDTTFRLTYRAAKGRLWAEVYERK